MSLVVETVRRLPEYGCVQFVELNVPPVKGRSPFNPSIAIADNGFLCTIRTTNSKIVDLRARRTDRNPVRSEHYLARLDNDLRISSIDLIEDATDPSIKFDVGSIGYQDLRIFQLSEGWKATATTKQHAEWVVNQTVLLDLDIEQNRITNAILLSTPFVGDQKNWMPVTGMNWPVLVTNCYPTKVIGVDEVRGATLEIATHSAPRVMRNLRGGGQLVPYSKGYVGIVHELTRRPTGGRVYLHRVLHFDSELRIDGISPPFVFQLHEVEFAAGLAHADGHFIIGYGENDCRALLAIIPDHELFDLLESV